LDRKIYWIIKMNIKNIIFHPYRNYVQYRVYSDHNYSLWNGVNNNNLYENKLVHYLIGELKKFTNPIFVDIGANIGLISLPLLASIHDLNIFAFEPNPLTYSWLKQTIFYNKLGTRIKFYQIALSDTNNNQDFFIHSPKLTPGDGLADTKRSGDTTCIKVKTQTIDDWWGSIGSPKINAVKIDTEGAELLVLKGGRNFLKTVKPLLCLEISPTNLKAYHLIPNDIFNWLKAIDYSYTRLDEEIYIAKQK